MISPSEIAGQIPSKIITVSAAYQASTEDNTILVNTTAAGVTVTLPDATKNVGKVIRAKKISSDGNTLTVACLNSQTIDGAATATTSTQWGIITVMSDGVNWQTIASAAGASFNGGSITAAMTINVSSATALVVGPNGTTNPTLQVTTNTASAATGIQVTSNAAGAGLGIATLSSGTNEDATWTTKGTGAFIVKAGANGNVFQVQDSSGAAVFLVNTGSGGIMTSLGRIVMPAAGLVFQATTDGAAFLVKNNALSTTFFSVNTSTGAVVCNGSLQNSAGVATPAGGSTAARLLMGSTAGFGIYYGSGAPTVSAAQGSIYLRSDGSSTSTRLYVNTDGGTTWTAVTTAA